ncbi:uncharacterized protein SAPINGB_P002053 [Magnusiomyces paraingens]|uniref:Uncharacterized protein n=1 Tax=Magnusiomyces paraingens TaxID=2606893 RepID=A0A5E8BD76_9ASCO|nr:uncharacterized protein SAPINGB_P002053 [Saprochaete ingens]VVT48997.1 unnamed protein product [Saprochaete ingens]
MRGLMIPPVTKVTLLLLVLFSLVVCLFRLNIYNRLLAIAEGPQVQPETDSRPVPKPSKPVYADISIPFLTLVPGLSVFYPWVLITTTYVETTILGFLATGATLLYGGRYCERVWNSKELARFLLIVGVSSNVAAWATAIFEYALVSATVAEKNADNSNTSTPVGKEFYLLQPINGGIAFQLAFLVALKQLVPEHSIVLFRGLFTIKVKHLVFPTLVLYTLIGIVYFRDLPFISQVWAGFFASWIYLRFLRYTYVDPVLPTTTAATSNDSGVSIKSAPGKIRIRGDASEVFSLANFFYPALLRDLIQSLATVVFRTLVAIKICTPFAQDEVEQGNLRASIRTTGNTAASAGGNGAGPSSAAGPRSAAEIEADRRRALALKALDEKLKTAQ